MKPFLSRLTGRHLDDAALAAIWTSVTAGGAVSVPPNGSDLHLASCAECRVRYDAFASWMEEIRADARLEADEVFTPERLVAQQAAVFRRLEASERPARVIAFPKFPVGGSGRSAPVRRWIAAAAAAGLLVGLGLGQLMDLRHLGDQRFPANRTVQQPRVDAPARAAVPVNAAINEEALLLELEASATPHYEALRAYDTLTPRAADFIKTSR